MPFTFRRSKKITPGLRANLSKGGVSLSTTGKRGGLTVGRRGVRARVSLPGGLTYRKRLSGCGLVLTFPALLAVGVLLLAVARVITAYQHCRPH